MESLKRYTQGFTLIELIMMIALLSIIGTLVLPILNKPFLIHQLSRDAQASSQTAIIVMNWIDKDLRDAHKPIAEGGVSVVGVHGFSVKTQKGTIRYEWQPETQRLNRRWIPSSGQLGSEQKVATNIQAMSVRWQAPYLNVNIDVGLYPDDTLKFWRQWTFSDS